MVEGFEPFLYVGLEAPGWGAGLGEGGEGVPEEMVVVGLRGDVVERCIGGAFGEGFVEFAHGEGFVCCAEDLLV